MYTLRPASLDTQRVLREWVGHAEPFVTLHGGTKRLLENQGGARWLHRNEAFDWYLTPDGTVHSVDNDRVAQEFVPAGGEEGLNAVAHAARAWPELSVLLPPRPPEARDCPNCGGAGDAGRTGLCECLGLGWVVHHLRMPSVRLQREILAWADREPMPEAERARLGRTALPLHRTQSMAWVLTPEGVVVHLDRYGGAYEHDPRTQVNSGALDAVVRAARRYPGLLEMLPPRPASARDCATCGGSGEAPRGFERCACMGLGWTL